MKIKNLKYLSMIASMSVSTINTEIDIDSLLLSIEKNEIKKKRIYFENQSLLFLLKKNKSFCKEKKHESLNLNQSAMHLTKT